MKEYSRKYLITKLLVIRRFFCSASLLLNLLVLLSSVFSGTSLLYSNFIVRSETKLSPPYRLSVFVKSNDLYGYTFVNTAQPSEGEGEGEEKQEKQALKTLASGENKQPASRFFILRYDELDRLRVIEGYQYESSGISKKRYPQRRLTLQLYETGVIERFSEEINGLVQSDSLFDEHGRITEKTFSVFSETSDNKQASWQQYQRRYRYFPAAAISLETEAADLFGISTKISSLTDYVNGQASLQQNFHYSSNGVTTISYSHPSSSVFKYQEISRFPPGDSSEQDNMNYSEERKLFRPDGRLAKHSLRLFRKGKLREQTENGRDRFLFTYYESGENMGALKTVFRFDMKTGRLLERKTLYYASLLEDRKFFVHAAQTYIRLQQSERHQAVSSSTSLMLEDPLFYNKNAKRINGASLTQEIQLKNLLRQPVRSTSYRFHASGSVIENMTTFRQGRQVLLLHWQKGKLQQKKIYTDNATLLAAYQYRYDAKGRLYEEDLQDSKGKLLHTLRYLYVDEPLSFLIPSTKESSSPSLLQTFTKEESFSENTGEKKEAFKEFFLFNHRGGFYSFGRSLYTNTKAALAGQQQKQQELSSLPLAESLKQFRQSQSQPYKNYPGQEAITLAPLPAKLFSLFQSLSLRRVLEINAQQRVVRYVEITQQAYDTDTNRMIFRYYNGEPDFFYTKTSTLRLSNFLLANNIPANNTLDNSPSILQGEREAFLQNANIPLHRRYRQNLHEEYRFLYRDNSPPYFAEMLLYNGEIPYFEETLSLASQQNKQLSMSLSALSEEEQEYLQLLEERLYNIDN